MAERPPARRRPTQQRSKEMVERILAAARAVLVDKGWDHASTNRIAEQAGISPGSLYQYFANKDELLAAVVDQLMEEVEARVTGAFMAGLREADLPATVRAVVDGVLSAMTVEQHLLAVVSRQAIGASAQRRDRFIRRMDDLLEAALLMRVAAIEPTRARALAWMVVRTFEALVVSYLLEEPDFSREQFVGEVSALVISLADL